MQYLNFYVILWSRKRGVSIGTRVTVKKNTNSPHESSEEMIEKYPLKDIYAVYIGNKNEIKEISICQKKKDENGKIIYYDLLTKKEYSAEEKNENETTVLKDFSLLSIISKKEGTKTATEEKIIENGYLTDYDLSKLYISLNVDKEYEEKRFTLGNGPVYWCPSFCNLITKTTHFFDDKDDTLIKLIINLTTSEKVPIISGKKGIGKSTIKNKINYYIKSSTNYLSKKEVWEIDYNDFKKNALTNKHIENRIKGIMKFIKKDQNTIFFIDNVDFSDVFFLNTIVKEFQNSNTKLILISSQELSEDNIDTNTFQFIEAVKPSPEIQRQILKSIFEENENLLQTKSGLKSEDINDIITILLDCDQSNCINQADYDNNPKLGKIIIENAYKIAMAGQEKQTTTEHFIAALNLDNIKMDKQQKEKTIKKFIELKIKIDERKKEEKAETESDIEKDSIGFKIKRLFFRNKKKIKR